MARFTVRFSAALLLLLASALTAASACPPSAPTACSVTTSGNVPIRYGTSLQVKFSGASDYPPGQALNYYVSSRQLSPGAGYWSSWSKETLSPTSWIFTQPAGTRLQWRARVQCGFLFWSRYFESAPVTIQNTPPTPPTACTITPQPADAAADLTASASGATDVDGQPLTYDYHWQLKQSNGVFVEAFHGNPLPASYTSGNQVWMAVVFASDGTAQSDASCSSAEFAISNTPPTPPTSLTIDPAAPACTDTITATATGATDPDNGVVIVDQISYEYQWYREMPMLKPRLMGISPTIHSAEMRRGQNWFVRARAADGRGGKSGWVSLDFTIANARPTAPTNVTITPAAPTEDQDLTADASGYSDADPGDTLTVTYQWLRIVDKRTDPGIFGTVLPASATSPGQVWGVRAKVSDGTDVSVWTYSAPVTIADVEHPPTAPTTVAITTLNPVEGDLIHINVAGATDPDGTEPGYELQWRRAVGGGAWGAWGDDGTVVAGTALDEVGTKYQMRARATDGVLTSDWVESNEVTLGSVIASTVPAASAVNAPRWGGLTVTYLRPVNQADVEAGFHMAAGAGEGPMVRGTFVWTQPNLTFRYKYVEPLLGNTQYAVQLQGTIRRLDGSMFTRSHSWVFSSNDRPVITAKRPTGTRVNVATNVVLVFDRAMNFDTVSSGFALTPAVPGVWTAGPALKTFTFNPDGNLAADTTYSVQLAGSIQDSTGVEMRSPFNWTFHTAVASPIPISGSMTAAATAAGQAQITLNLSAAAQVQVSICNLAGRTVATLPAGTLPAGISTLLWNGRAKTGSAVPPGAYLVRCRAMANGGSCASVIAPLTVR